MIILNVLLVIFCIYIINYLIVALYCEMKKKRKARQKSINSESTEIRSETNKNAKKKIVQWIVDYMSGWIRYSIIRLGKVPCHTYRNFLLKHVYKMSLGENVVIYGGFEIRDPWNITIGKGTIIGDNVILDGRNGITIGENVNFSTGVWIWTEQHDYNDAFFSANHKGGEVLIGDRVWLSSRVSILPSTKVDEGTVIAAGAVVTKDCSAYSVYGGVPAKKLGERNRDLKYEFNGKHLPFY